MPVDPDINHKRISDDPARILPYPHAAAKDYPALLSRDSCLPGRGRQAACEPGPASWGERPQDTPVFGTNRMPVRPVRLSIGVHPECRIRRGFARPYGFSVLSTLRNRILSPGKPRLSGVWPHLQWKPPCPRCSQRILLWARGSSAPPSLPPWPRAQPGSPRAWWGRSRCMPQRPPHSSLKQATKYAVSWAVVKQPMLTLIVPAGYVPIVRCAAGAH